MLADQHQRLPAEQLYAGELATLIAHDSAAKPTGWALSPKMVKTFIVGSNEQPIGDTIIQRKIYGNDDVVEKAIVTLIGQRGLMLVGEPGTAKSLLSELLAAAISGNSKYTVQGSAGIVEENIRYSWNYALLLKLGAKPEALVPGPLHNAMAVGAIMRFEEITRCPTEIQDNLIPVMSDKIMHIPELNEQAVNHLLSRPGFNIIATANLKDRGVNEMSAALKRRFNFETMRPLTKQAEQTQLIHREVNKQLTAEQIPLELSVEVADVLSKAFYEMRAGSVEGAAITSPSTVLSTAEAISVAYSAAIECHYFGENIVKPAHLAKYMLGTVIKDNNDDMKCFQEYLRVVKRKRSQLDDWQDFASQLS